MSYHYYTKQDRPRHAYNSPYTNDIIHVSPGVLFGYVLAGVLVCYNVIQKPLSLPPIWMLIVYPFRFLLSDERQNRLQSLFGHSFQRLQRGSEKIIDTLGVPSGPSRGMMNDANEGWVGGLYNIGNTCYQNSILQALASLSYLPAHLEAISEISDEFLIRKNGSPCKALQGVIRTLNTRSRWPHAITVPSLLKLNSATSSWYHEQQDAQEFFQSLTHTLESEASGAWKSRLLTYSQGLEMLISCINDETVPKTLRMIPNKDFNSPFQGLIAQRVGCLSCGYVEAIRMQEFTSMSLALPSNWTCTIEQCLEEYTSVETLTSVPCEKCTLLATADLIKSMLLNASNNTTNSPSKVNSKATEEIQERLQSRLVVIEDALHGSDFSKEVLDKCRISPKSLKHSNKTKQIMIARPPPVLVLHLNRSMFDLASGGIRKNHASLRFQPYLNMQRWVVGDVHGFEVDPARPMRSIEKENENTSDNYMYVLRSIVTHYGSHGNGHYVSYRQTLPNGEGSGSTENSESIKKPTWWRCSDDELRPCSIDEVLSAGNAFMLFYERMAIGELSTCGTILATSKARNDFQNNKYDNGDDDEAYESDQREISPMSSSPRSTSPYTNSISTDGDLPPILRLSEVLKLNNDYKEEEEEEDHLESPAKSCISQDTSLTTPTTMSDSEELFKRYHSGEVVDPSSIYGID